MLKEMALADCAAGKRRTGMDTSPNEMVPDASERSGIRRL
jgi:hypothetical protein